jgi:hypothetical protein
LHSTAAAIQQALSALKSAVEKGLSSMAIILSLTLLWLAFSQVAVVVLGWRAFRGRDTLVRSQQPPPVY